MKTKGKFTQRLLLGVGVALLLASIVTAIYLKTQADKIRIDCFRVIPFIQEVLPARSFGIKNEQDDSSMPSISYEGQEYSALLEVPRMSVKLPVASSWDKKTVQKTPCRFSGTVYNGTLVIGGVYKQNQFDFISRLDVGDVITITDMKGCQFSYIVSTVRHSENVEAQTLMDDNFDLTLFVKNKKSGLWLLARCNMK